MIDYANSMIGLKNYKYLTPEQADSNDGKVDSSDATLVLIYYANALNAK